VNQLATNSVRTRPRTGAVLPLIALMLPIMLLLAGFAINVAYIQLTTTELQISTDIAAKAAGGTFTRTLDKTLALADLLIGASVFDVSTQGYEFIAGAGNNGVQVLGRREAESANGEVNTFFPSLMGVQSFPLNASSVSTRIDVDIALVIDRSGSMAYSEDESAVFPPGPRSAPADWNFGQPVPPLSRWESAYEGVSEFLTELENSALNEKVSLITYAGGASIDQELTNQYNFVLSDLDSRFLNFNGGGTNIKSGINRAAVSLDSPEARNFAAKVIVLMTDGQITSGGHPGYRISRLAEQGIMTVTISFSDEADTRLMQNLATRGGGFHIHAVTKDDLKNAFRDIVRRLPSILTK